MSKAICQIHQCFLLVEISTFTVMKLTFVPIIAPWDKVKFLWGWSFTWVYIEKILEKFSNQKQS
jgi:hypothetical protein